MTLLNKVLAVVVAAGCLGGAQALNAADLKLAGMFTDNMVLQRDQPALVRGFADAGAVVTVAFGGQQKQATAGADGAWSVTLDPLSASTKPQDLKVSAAKGKPLTVSNVLVGDVFLMARQTSIDISLGRDEQGKAEAAALKANPNLRAISIKARPASSPQADLAAGATDGWTAVGKDSALKMTAAAYYLGRDLAAKGDVPVGIIDLNLGSAFPISWLSREALEETEKFYGKSDVPGQLSYHDKLLEAEATGVPLPKQKTVESNVVERILFPAGGYNAVLAPMKGITIKAAMIQLGNDYPYMIYADLERKGTQFDRAELNRAYVETYDLRKNGFRMEPVTTPRIPREWRKVFANDALPIGLIVPPGSDLNTLGQHHREMRELQRVTAEPMAGVGVILPGSANIPFSAQPADDALLAERCLAWVNGAVYQKPGIPATGPLFDRVEGNFSEATVYFKAGTAKGLQAKGDALGFFEAADIEGEYSPAKAVIMGETIRIKSDTVPRIARVRYNWNSRPNQDLVNAAGLPAIPFRSEKLPHHWFVTNEDGDLPEEYSTPASAWKKNDVTLVNGQLKTHGYDNFSGWVGPVGIMTGPFGPNMGVRVVKSGSPAEGKILAGDVIYSANGTMLGDKAWEVMADAITQSETREGGGKLVLGVRRGGANIDVEITLEVMGTYSSTAPYACPKTEKIIADLEKWVVANGANAGFLNTDALFMLATGNPELQGYVRRIVYQIMAGRDPNEAIDTAKAGKSWQNSAEAILLGEYYHATGDRNVLPYLKHVCDRLAATQNKEYGGWRHNYPGGATYGLIPNAGLPGVIGMHLASVAGLDINREEFARAIHHYSEGKAETGFLIYGYGECQRMIPEPFEVEKFYTGKQETFNGGLSAAGILMGLTGNVRAAHLCSLKSAFSWNNTFHGHGGNFWNNFWSPLGANQHCKSAFTHFWKNYRWYRECNRMFDGSLIQHEDGRAAAGTGVALVAPRARIQIVGAPLSPFATNAPPCLAPAVESYWKKDYAGCANQVSALIASGVVGKDDMPTVEYLGRAALEIQESIASDLVRMKKLCEESNPAQARTFLAGLKGIMPEGDERLAAIEKEIASTKQGVADVKTVKAADDMGDVVDADDAAKKAEAAAIAAEEAARKAAEGDRKWACLVSEEPSSSGKKADDLKAKPEKASTWKMLVVEDMAQAPNGWAGSKFDDSGWKQTALPISWRMYHTALLRTKFNVDDVKAYDKLRFRAWLFRQQGIEIFLNGELIGKVNNLEQKTGDVDAEFIDAALKHLKNGENTLAITTRHNWRWGMLSMHVYNDGFDFNLDARLKK